jgi:hypothetical protein
MRKKGDKINILNTDYPCELLEYEIIRIFKNAKGTYAYLCSRTDKQGNTHQPTIREEDMLQMA